VVRHSGKHWAFLHVREAGRWHPQSGRLPLSGRAGFPLFDRVTGALPQEGLVVSAWPLCSVGEGSFLAPAEQQSMEPGVHLRIWWWAPGTE
jgi:hypothetical protein